MNSTNRFFLSSLIAWMGVIAVDFLSHATLLSPFWSQEYPALKSKIELFRLIPFGYLSYYILLLLVGWLYMRIYGARGNIHKGLAFGLTFGLFYAFSTFFGWFSALRLPFVFIMLISLTYFFEIAMTGFVFGFLMHVESVKKRIWILLIFILSGLVLGIVLQNVLIISPASTKSF